MKLIKHILSILFAMLCIYGFGLILTLDPNPVHWDLLKKNDYGPGWYVRLWALAVLIIIWWQAYDHIKTKF